MEEDSGANLLILYKEEKPGQKGLYLEANEYLQYLTGYFGSVEIKYKHIAKSDEKEKSINIKSDFGKKNPKPFFSLLQWTELCL